MPTKEFVSDVTQQKEILQPEKGETAEEEFSEWSDSSDQDKFIADLQEQIENFDTQYPEMPEE